LKAAGAGLVAISADEPRDLDALRERLALTFPLVSDASLAIAEAYGVREKGEDLSLPATLVVGPKRVVRFARVGKNPIDRPAVDEILAVLRR